MNNKLLSYSLVGYRILVVVLLAILVFSRTSDKLGGMSNYDSLTLQPETSSDNALVVKNSAGTAQITVYGSGGLLIAGTSTQSGAATLSGTNRFNVPVITGLSVAALAGTTTTVVTAAIACAGDIGQAITSITEASTLNLPTAEAMNAACLTTNGDSVSFLLRNMTASTTVITAGSASTTINIISGGTVTLGALGWAKITLLRAASNLMMAFVSVLAP